VKEVGFALIGACVYAALLWLLGPHVGHFLIAFLFGYCLVATVDLWRCWRSVHLDRARATTLELAYAAVLLFPLGSLLWLPWDAYRAIRA
jgi:hypothetical protein